MDQNNELDQKGAITTCFIKQSISLKDLNPPLSSTGLPFVRAAHQKVKEEGKS